MPSHTWTVGEVVTASNMNVEVRDHRHSAESLGPVVRADFTDATAPAAPASGQTSLFTTGGRTYQRAFGGAAQKLLASGDNETKRRIYIPAFSCNSPTSNGAADGIVNGSNKSYRTKDFDQTTSESIDIEVPLPAEYGGGSITVTFFWTAAAGTAAQGVYWRLSTDTIGNDEPFDSALSDVANGADVLLAVGDLHVISGTWSSTLPVAGEMVALKIKRMPAEGADTLAADARLIGVSLDFGVA